MHRLTKTVKVLLLVMIVLLGSKTGAYAEQLNSVKDCIEQPDKCSEKKPTSKTDQLKSDNQSQTTVGLTIWDFVKMIFATVFVVALLYFLLKFINKKSKSYKSNQLIESLGGTSLGTNRSVQLVKIGNRILVVGVGENIQLLKEIDDESESRQIIEDYNNKIEQLVQPSDIVTKVLQRARTKKASNDMKSESSFSDLLKSQLEDMSKGRKKIFEEMEKKGPDDQ